MKILVACRAFDNMAGGVERMATALMGAYCERGHEVHLLTWDNAEAKPFYKMDERIAWHKLDLGDQLQVAGWKLRFARAKKTRKIIKDINPKVMIAFQHGTFIAMRIYTLGINIPIVAAERNAPHRFDYLREGKYENLIYPTFLLADRITIQCESYRSRYPFYLHKRMATIPNPVFPVPGRANPAGEQGQGRTLLCVGRLSFQKNQTVLVQAFAMLADSFPGWRLLLAGEGEDRAGLEAQIKNLDMSDRILLSGAVNDVSALYASSHLFCLPSRWEGFPNALAEAFSHGLPAVGFAGCAGVCDLIDNEKSGLLAPGNGNAASLAKALRRMMSDSGLRARMGNAGLESMKAYVPKTIFDRWDELAKEVSQK